MEEGRTDMESTTHVDTPRGIFTAQGVWFHATEAALEAYAGPVLEREPLPKLLADAQVWLRSAQTLALWALPLLLWLLPPLPAALAALTLYLGWKVLAPGFVTRAGVAALRRLDTVILQGLYFVFALSVLAGMGQTTAVWVGLAGFILLRWGLVAKASRPLVERLWPRLYPLPVPDQVLRALIVRVALKYGLSLPQIDRLEAKMQEKRQRKGKTE